MPPRSKRSKVSSAAPVPTPKNQSREDPPETPTEEDLTGNASNISTPPSVRSIDLALMDEEEVPGAPSSGGKRAYAGGYDALKTYNGQVYSGMAIGGSHTWNYDQGVWKETKMEPDLWKIDYRTHKRRARNAPKGSGAPVGTEYHWYIVAHQVNHTHPPCNCHRLTMLSHAQYVKKMDANTYETHLTGSKYKLAHKGATSKSWSIPTVKGQREREMELLDDVKRRIQGLPPVLAGEKVRVEEHEKGQQKLDSLFAKAKGIKGPDGMEKKRKREDEKADDEEEEVVDEIHEE